MIALVLASVVALGALPTMDALFAIAFAALTLWLAKSDIERFELPDLTTLAVAAFGLIWIGTLPDPGLRLLDAAQRAIVAAACLSAVKRSYASVRGREGLGWGDVKLAAAGAFWLDWPQLPIALFFAAAAAIIAVAARAILAREPISGFAAIPFGAFLAPSIWVAWLADRAGLF
jgi:leader peptidase (prepilin peptidase)/N-methyltransferase